jgi:hypothetical protein
VNDLYLGHPAEESLWTALKQDGMDAERQYRVREVSAYSLVDFAIVAPKGGVAVSTPLSATDILQLDAEGWDELSFPPHPLARRMPDVIEQIRGAVDRRGIMITEGGQSPSKEQD